jgi:hypothetical protein
MRKIIVYIATSADAYIARPDGAVPLTLSGGVARLNYPGAC